MLVYGIECQINHRKHMAVPYETQTLNHPNFIARFAHRSRHRKSISLVTTLLNNKASAIVDYGCGKGAFVEELRREGFGFVYGYEPFMEQSQERDYIFKNLSDFPPKSTELITLFETIEHLDEGELDLFFNFCNHCLRANGKILVSAPVELGPAVIVKDLVRSLLFKRGLEYKLIELIKCGIFGINVSRSQNIKGSHKGFDFRKSISFIKENYGDVRILGFGPLPLKTWYGNSQVYFHVNLNSD